MSSRFYFPMPDEAELAQRRRRVWLALWFGAIATTVTATLDSASFFGASATTSTTMFDVVLSGFVAVLAWSTLWLAIAKARRKK